MEKAFTVAEAFRKSYDLFQDKSRWSKGYYQRDKAGNECPWREGYSFCALGALCFFTDGLSNHATCALQRISEYLYDGRVIQDVNDNDPQGYEKVLKALEFGMEFWKDHDPTSEEVSLEGGNIARLLEARNGYGKL